MDGRSGFKEVFFIPSLLLVFLFFWRWDRDGKRLGTGEENREVKTDEAGGEKEWRVNKNEEEKRKDIE